MQWIGSLLNFFWALVPDDKDQTTIVRRDGSLRDPSFDHSKKLSQNKRCGENAAVAQMSDHFLANMTTGVVVRLLEIHEINEVNEPPQSKSNFHVKTHTVSSLRGLDLVLPKSFNTTNLSTNRPRSPRSSWWKLSGRWRFVGVKPPFRVKLNKWNRINVYPGSPSRPNFAHW